jgi:predicted aminopeptidase
VRLRRFAKDELKLQPDDCYLKYADLHRPYVVWNVNVAPRLSLEPKTWWFPIVGSVSYLGYFSEDGARRCAGIWDDKGWDTYIGDVPAYSTLGWFHDPLLNTFIFESDAELADTIFHELSHRRLFVAGDTDFNEAFATMVAEEGVRRWFAAAGTPRAFEVFMKDVREGNDFVALVLATRDELQKVYVDAHLSDALKLQRKAEVIGEMRLHFAKLKESWGVTKSGYDHWFAEPVNNAQLNTVAAYYDLVPAFQALLRANGGDLDKFYTAVEGLAKMPLDKRHQALRAYLTLKESNRT